MRYRGSYYPDGSTQYIDEFGGLDLRNRIANNAFSEMLNMSPEGAPEIVTRAYRYLSKASFGAGEIIDAITTVTVLRPGATEYTEEPAYVLSSESSFRLVIGADGDETSRGFFSLDLSSFGYYGYGHSLAVIGRRIMVAPEMILVDLDTGDVESVNVTATATKFAYTDVDLTNFGTVIDTNTPIYTSMEGHPGAGDPSGSYTAVLMGTGAGRVPGGISYTFDTHLIRRYYAQSAAWRTQNKYLKLYTTEAAKFHAKDAVTISGTGTAIDGDYLLDAVGENYVVINGEFEDIPFDPTGVMHKEDGVWEWDADWDGWATFGPSAEALRISATITRKKPPIVQHICESGNRIWWCGFGKAGDELINEIGCSKQGDPLNYYALATGDSWITNVGTAGEFTGAAEVGGQPVFFKESAVYEVSGTQTSTALRVTKRDTRGIEKNSSGALCVSGGAVYYQASDGPRVYGGSYSQRLTGAFGSTDVDACAFASDGRLVYMAGRNVTEQNDGAPVFAGEDTPGHAPAAVEEGESSTPVTPGLGNIGSALNQMLARIARLFARLTADNPALFVYDTERGAIYRLEDHLFTCLASVKSGGVVGYDATARRIVSTVPLAETDKEITPVPWQITTGDVYANTPDMKYISAARVRMRVAAGGYAELWLSCDRGQWARQAFFDREGVFTYRVPIIPGRCDSFRLRMSGEGQARLVSIAYEITDGGQNSGQTF